MIYHIFNSKCQLFFLIGKNGILKTQKKALFLRTQWIWLAEVTMDKMWTQIGGVPHHLKPIQPTRLRVGIFVIKVTREVFNIS